MSEKVQPAKHYADIAKKARQGSAYTSHRKLAEYEVNLAASKGLNIARYSVENFNHYEEIVAYLKTCFTPELGYTVKEKSDSFDVEICF